jgi:hypothetical protein
VKLTMIPENLHIQIESNQKNHYLSFCHLVLFALIKCQLEQILETHIELIQKWKKNYKNTVN